MKLQEQMFYINANVAFYCWFIAAELHLCNKLFPNFTHFPSKQLEQLIIYK